MLVRIFSFFFLLAVSTGAFGTHAQMPNLADPLSVRITPEFPRPFDTITIAPESTILNLASTEITVSVNGVIVGEGSGSGGSTYTLGTAGTKYTIRMTAVSEGKTYEKSVTLIPADVGLVLEPVSSVPAFYQGGELVAPEGRLRIVAMPNIRTASNVYVSPEKLSYTWRLGNQVLQKESGIGRSVLLAVGPLRYRSAVVSVTVTTTDGEVTAHTSTAIAPADPVVRIYENDPLYGLNLSKAVTGIFSMVSEEETFRAVPYFFALQPTFAWSLNSTSAGAEQDLTVRTTSSNAGTASVGLSAETEKQSADDAFTVSFKASRGNSLFGL